eukprot:g443.t1
MSSSSMGLPPRSKSTSMAQNKLKEEELRKRMRTARREKALKAMLHTYDLRGVDPEEAMKVAEMLDDIGTRSASPVHLLYVPKNSPVKEIESTINVNAITGLGDTRKINLKKDATFLKNLKRRFIERIEVIKDKIETTMEDVEFIKSQIVACNERTASHNNAPRAQDSDAVVILPVTGSYNCSEMNTRMLQKSREILIRRTMNKRAEVNDAVGENMTIKYDIDNLRREKTTFVKIFTNMSEEVNSLKEQVRKDEEDMEEVNRERDELMGEYKQVVAEWDEKRAELENEYSKIGKAIEESERLEKLAKEAEEKARKEERTRKREEAKQQRARERAAQAITVVERNQMFEGNPSPLSSPLMSGAKKLGVASDETLATSQTIVGKKASSSTRQHLPRDAMEEMIVEMETSWLDILKRTNSNALKTEMDENQLSEHICDILRKDDDERFRLAKDLQNEKNRVGILEAEVNKMTRELKTMEENKDQGDSADIGIKKLISTLSQSVKKMENTFEENVTAYISRKDNMVRLSDHVNTCYLRAGGAATEESENTNTSPLKGRDTASKNTNSGDEDDIGIERLKPSDLKVLEQVGFLEVQLKQSVEAYAMKAFDVTSNLESSNLLSPSSDSMASGRRGSSSTYRRSIVQERLGEITLSKPLRSMTDRVPRVEIPDDMDVAIGLDDVEQLGDKPFLRKEMEERYEANLSRITKGASTSMLNDTESSEQQSSGMGIGLIDEKEKLRNEQQELYRRVAVYAIKEQQGNTRMRKHFQENMENSLDENNTKMAEFPEGLGGSQLDNEFNSKYDEGSKYEGKYSKESLQSKRQTNGQNLLVIKTEKL